MTARQVVVAAEWSATWAVGVAMGVAAGAYLTVVGASGAPGAGALGTTELVMLPLAAGVLVFVVSLLVRVILGLFTARHEPEPCDEAESNR